jgi:hypothetical protein
LQQVRLVMRGFGMLQALRSEPGGQLWMLGFPGQCRVMHKGPWSPQRLVFDKKAV